MRIEQYFFKSKVSKKLASLSKNFDNVLFLCTPTVAKYANGYLFDIDSKVSVYSNNYFKYDINRGLHSNHQKNGNKFSKFEYSFDFIIFDPPFSLVTPYKIVRNINCFLNWKHGSKTLLCYPKSGINAIHEQCKYFGMVLTPHYIRLRYINSPRNMGFGERKEIKLYQIKRKGFHETKKCKN